MNHRLAMGWLILTSLTLNTGASAESTFRAGASAIDISPRQLPAIRNGGFLEGSYHRVEEPLHARSLVLSDGVERIAISVVDSCMLPTDVCDAIKSEVKRRTGIATDRILCGEVRPGC